MTGGDVPAAVDESLMARALHAAGAAHGRTRPNPAVGAVVVRDGHVVGTGATQPPGGAHAEVVALRSAGERAAGATLYVTLEPCAHHGRTPPCTDAIVAAGVQRVVYAISDPNPAAAGGAEALRSAGVATTGGVLAGWAAHQNLEFLQTVATPGRPHVTLKLAQTPTGSLEPETGRWITGPEARRVVHARRARSDAVLVGSGTVIADDPGLDVREAPLLGRQPVPVVLDARGRTPVEARIVGRGALVLTSVASTAAWRRDLAAAGATVEVIPSAPGGGLDLGRAMGLLVQHGIHAVLAEPGRVLAAAMVRADLVDLHVLHVAIGDTEASAVRPVPGLDPTSSWALVSWRRLGPDLEVVRRPADRVPRPVPDAARG